ncbi:hypothetical protein WAI453_008578 [Rhynchosporium graminicola]
MTVRRYVGEWQIAWSGKRIRETSCQAMGTTSLLPELFENSLNGSRLSINLVRNCAETMLLVGKRIMLLRRGRIR